MITTLIGYLVNTASAAAFITMPSSTPTDLTASITSQITDPGTLAVIILVAGIPLFFYVVKKIIGLIPKR
jgi:hypothetical protein